MRCVAPLYGASRGATAPLDESVRDVQIVFTSSASGLMPNLPEFI